MNGYKILLADDDKKLLTMLKKTFEDKGFSVITTADGETAITLALNEQPHIILLDIDIPERDGLSVLKLLRENDWGKNVPVIMLTNSDKNENIKKALENKATHYLVKTDWSLVEIENKVSSILEN